MPDRRPALRAFVAALFLFGFVHEAGHLRHHLEHARHHDEPDHASHRECLVFHSGALTEDPVTVPAGDATVARAEIPTTVRAVAVAPSLLPDSRAPPPSC